MSYDADIDELIESFQFLEDWEERYRHIIDMGRHLPPLEETEKIAANKVQGCVSQVWLVSRADSGADPQMHFRADSDAHIVRGLIAILLHIFSGKSASHILQIDIKGIMSALGLDQHLSPSRTNGLFSMIEHIRTHARRATA